MEQNLLDVNSDSLNKTEVKSVLHSLIDTMDNAIDLRDEDTAQNPELRRAIIIVEYFYINSSSSKSAY